MKIFRRIISLAAVALSVAACSYEVIENDYHQPEQIVSEAGFVLPTDGARALLDEDGVTTNWEIGDQLYLWAENARGEFVAENVKFMLRYFSPEYSEAYFSGDLAEMAEGEYSYTLAYPAPAAVNGRQLTYKLPAIQNGIYDDRYDVMVASSVKAPQLTGENRAVLNCVLKHQMHALKITLPQSSNHFGKSVETITLTFPCAVVGDMIIDLDNPNAQPTYANTSNTITLSRDGGFDFDSPIWVFVLPGTADGEVSYQVSNAVAMSATKTFAVSRVMEAGHVTPIRMATGAVEKSTSLSFTVGANNLGEDFNSFEVYAPGENIKPLAVFARNSSNLYTISVPNTASLNAWQNGTFRIVYDSPNAIVESSVNVGTLNVLDDNRRTINVPYLFAEDFSGISSFSDGHDDPANGFSGDSKNYSSAFSSYTSNARMAGWTGGRYQCNSGALRTCCRSESGLGAIAHYRGRIDSAPISTIKSGKSITVRVQFNYSGANRSYGSVTKGNPCISFGYTTTSGVIAPTTNLSNVQMSKTTITDTSGSFTNVNQSADKTFSGCTNATRLSWMAETTAKGSWGGNVNSWIYIDNIRVSIAQ